MNEFARCKYVGFGLLLLAAWAGVPAHAQAQQYGLNPSNRPAFSPYLNLLRSGSSPGVNYYGIVRPEIFFSNSLYQLQGQQSTLANRQEDLAAYTALPATGHASGFQTQAKYFMTSGGQGQSGGFAAPAGLTAPKGR